MQSQAPLPRPLGPVARSLYVACAFVGSAVYALSFRHRPDAQQLLPLAWSIGIAAGASWMVFGAALATMEGWRRGRVMAWFDVCLRTIAAGMLIKMGIAAANLLPAVGGSAALSFRTHIALLAAVDCVMAAVFVWRARGLGVGPAKALALWTLVLNGCFALLLAALRGVMG
jgi:hypothetical protein